jgi:hypothetical protein
MAELFVNSTENQQTADVVEPNLLIINHYDDKNRQLDTPFVNQGDIFDEKRQLVCRGLPISKELQTWQQVETLLDEKSNLKIRGFIEGSLIRIFYFNEKWNIATSRKLNAFFSKWGSITSFGELFENFLKKDFNSNLELFYESLNPIFNYYFLFTSESVYYIHPSSKSSLILLQIIDKEGNLVLDSDVEQFGITRLEYSSKEDIRQKFEANQVLGVVLENENERYTLFSENYTICKNLYGKQKFLAQRILELMENEQQKFDYMHYFPTSKKYFQLIQDEVNNFCRKAHRVYVQRYIQKNFIEVEPNLNHFVKSLHQNFKENRKPTFLADVIKFFHSKNVDSKFSYIRKYLPIEIGGKLL